MDSNSKAVLSRGNRVRHAIAVAALIFPTIGFSGKLFIFVAAMQKGYLALVIIAMVNVVISLYYYLMVLKAAYLDEPAEATPAIDLSLANRLIALAMIALIVGVGFYPTPLMDWVQAAVLRLP